jgi:hypothetical protein
MDPDFKRGLLVIPRRNGKDLLCWNALIAKAHTEKEPHLYYYIAPYYNQVRQIIWEGFTSDRRFMDYIPKSLIANKTKVDMRVDLKSGDQIKLMGSDMVDRIVGTNPYGIVFTEYSLHKPAAWDYLSPILAENGGWALFNGTPRGLNHMYHLYKNALKHPEEWYVQYLTRDDTGVPTLEAIESERRSGKPESTIQQEYYCNWAASSEETLIPLDIIQPAINYPIEQWEYNNSAKIIGADVAYAARGDKASLAKRQGRLLHPLETFQGLNNMAFATRIVEEFKTWGADGVMIDGGRGEGVISRLAQLGMEEYVIPIHFSGRPSSRLYLNKRAEIWGRCKDWFMAPKRPSIPNDINLIAGLSGPKSWVNDKGYIQLESKIQLKTRQVLGLDEADSVCLTFGEEFVERKNISPEDEFKIQMMQNRTQGKYDPSTFMENYSNYEIPDYSNSRF